MKSAGVDSMHGVSVTGKSKSAIQVWKFEWSNDLQFDFNSIHWVEVLNNRNTYLILDEN